MVKTKSKGLSNRNKVLLGAGFGVIVILIVLAVFLVPMAEKKAVAGKAVLSPAQFEDYCQQKTPAGAFHGVETAYLDANGKVTGKDAVNGCCFTKKDSCYSPSKEICFDTGKVHDDYAGYFCKKNDWYVCEESGKGKVQQGVIYKDGTYYKDDGTKVIALKDGEMGYLCNGKMWVGCGEENKGKYYLFGNSISFCDGTDWNTKTLTPKQGSTKLVTSSMREATIIPVVNIPLWPITEPWYKADYRVGWCKPAESCITKGGDCYNYDDIVNKNSLCQVGDWRKCNNNAKGLTSFSGKNICDGAQWLTCTSALDTTDAEVSGYQCKDGYWVDKQKCSNIPAGKKCVVSDVVRKTDNNKMEYEIVKSASNPSGPAPSDSYVGGISVQDPSSCVYYEKGVAKTKKYDTFEIDAGLFADKNYLCGDNNDWLLCDKDSANIVSDGGKYICGKNGNIWKWLTISSMSSSNTKGCSDCTGNNKCVVSDMKSIIDGKWTVGVGSDLSNFAYSSGRVGCVSEADSCVNVAGTEQHKDKVVSDTKLCGINNDWFQCTSTGVGQLRNYNSFLCAKDVKWKKCSTPGDVVDQFLCNNDNQWEKCDYIGEVCTFGYCETVTANGVKYECKGSMWTPKTEAVPQTTTETDCTNQIDDDQDGVYDCADADCKGIDISGKQCVTSTIAVLKDSKGGYDMDLTSLTPANMQKRSGLCDTNIDCISTDKTCTKNGDIFASINLCKSNIFYKCVTTGKDAVMNGWKCDGSKWILDWAPPLSDDIEICTNKIDDDSDGAIDAKDKDCLGTSCTPITNSGSAVNPLFIWSYNLPSEQALKDAGTLPARAGCCGKDQCVTSAGLCKNVKDLVSADAYLCIESNTWARCGGTGYLNGKHELGGDYTCDGTKWVAKTAPPATETNCADGITNDADALIDCADSDCANDVACKTPTVTLGDVNGNGCLTEAEFNDFSYDWINNVGSIQITVTDATFNDYQYNYINNIEAIQCK